ncbi:MAG: DUF2065 family protein [Litorimonas sp.]
MDWITIALLTLGGAMLFEGLGWALAPDAMRRAYDEMTERLGRTGMVQVGGLCAALGLLMIVAAIRFSGS